MAFRTLTDTDEMPFGPYFGKQMIDVPAEYLLNLKKNGLRPGNVLDYIISKEAYLKKEVEDAKNKKS